MTADLPTSPSTWPRLLSTREAAKVLGVTTWTVYDYVAQDLILPVRMPPLRPKPGEKKRRRFRRLLFDRRDLDGFVDRLKRGNR